MKLDVYKNLTLGVYELSDIIYIWVETPLHPGSSAPARAIGIDLPIQRNPVTNIPIIQASSLKGALRSLLKENNSKQILFGSEPAETPTYPGCTLILNAETLLFPLMSAVGLFAWVTSPLQLATLEKALELAGDESLREILTKINVNKDEALIPNESNIFIKTNEKKVVFLESFAFKAREDGKISEIAKRLAEIIFPEEPFYQELKAKFNDRLVILSDETFKDMTIKGTEKSARIRLNPETKTVERGGLWTEEHLPPLTCMFTQIFFTKARSKYEGSPEIVVDAKSARELFRGFIKENLRVIFGGDETTGHGICRLKIHGLKEGPE